MSPATRALAVLVGIAMPVGLVAVLPSLVPSSSSVDPVTRVGVLEAEAVMTPQAAPAASPAQAAADRTESTTSRPPAPDARWVARTARRTGIGARALTAYATADLRTARAHPGCHLSWATLAGIGSVESRHGTIGGRVLDAAGHPAITPIIGVQLTGAGPVAQGAASDDGALDGDSSYDRAVGPMQFLPSTWAVWGSDGDGDGVSDPQDIDDAAWSAARYLCAAGGRLDSPTDWTRAILSYNESDIYVSDVVEATNTYALRARA